MTAVVAGLEPGDGLEDHFRIAVHAAHAAGHRHLAFDIVGARGFEVVREEWRRCTYTANAMSMMKTDYTCVFFTAIKPVPSPPPEGQ